MGFLRCVLLAGLLALCGSVAGALGAPSGLVEHAVVPAPIGFPSVELWRDASNGKVAIHHVGETALVLIEGRTVAHVDQVALTELATFRSTSSAWFGVQLRFGLTQSAASAALAAGDEVPRPSLMKQPQPSPNFTFTRVWDYDTSLTALQRSVAFPIPKPGPRLAGLQLADAARARTREAGSDSGLTAMIVYSSNPQRLGTDDHELTLNASSATSPEGITNGSFFKTLTAKITGYGWEARFGKGNWALLHWRGTYVAVTPPWTLTQSGWRTLLSRIAR